MVNGMNNIQEKRGEYIMKKLTFKKKGVEYKPIKYWDLEDDITIAIYQGNRGTNPDLDYVVKYLAPNRRLRTPSHTHWIVDLLIKAQFDKNLVKQFVENWLSFYEQSRPFRSKTERDTYTLMYTHIYKKRFEELSQYGEYNVDFLSAMMELFIKCEKQSDNAFMFKNLLKLVLEYCDEKKDFYQVISHSKRV
jgi:hypothetical protein